MSKLRSISTLPLHLRGAAASHSNQATSRGRASSQARQSNGCRAIRKCLAKGNAQTMSQNDVREAAARLTQLDNGLYNDGGGAREDGYAVARAYLAEHPADDDTPVDSVWLQIAGAKPSTLSPAIYGYTFEGLGLSLNICRDQRQRWMATLTQDDTDIPLGEHKSRGDVRALCCGFGIPLTEPRATEAQS